MYPLQIHIVNYHVNEKIEMVIELWQAVWKLHEIFNMKIMLAFELKCQSYVRFMEINITSWTIRMSCDDTK